MPWYDKMGEQWEKRKWNEIEREKTKREKKKTIQNELKIKLHGINVSSCSVFVVCACGAMANETSPLYVEYQSEKKNWLYNFLGRKGE